MRQGLRLTLPRRTQNLYWCLMPPLRFSRVAHSYEFRNRKELVSKLAFYIGMSGLLLSGSPSIALPHEQSFVYCGKLLWPAQRDEYLPFPEGIEATYSTQPEVAQAIQKFGTYSVSLSYEDMSMSYRLLRDAIDMIISKGINEVCIKAGIIESSQGGNLIQVSPTTTGKGEKVVFDRVSDKDRE